MYRELTLSLFMVWYPASNSIIFILCTNFLYYYRFLRKYQEKYARILVQVCVRSYANYCTYGWCLSRVREGLQQTILDKINLYLYVSNFLIVVYTWLYKIILFHQYRSFVYERTFPANTYRVTSITKKQIQV